MAERIYNEQEMFETFRLKRKLREDELDASPTNISYGNDGRMILMTAREWFAQRKALYKVCGICGEPFCINNTKWNDGQSRTPRFKGFVICPICDPRHPDDRYMKEGYRVSQPVKLRVIRYAQVTRALARMGCLRPMIGTEEEMKDYDANCKCAGCAAVKLIGAN